MNVDILNQYKISFQLLNVKSSKSVVVTSAVIPYFDGFIIKQYPEHLLGDTIPEINKAINGQSFDEDAGGVFNFLVIGPTNSHFVDEEGNQFTLPTLHIKEILLSYVEWITANNYEKYI
jgi:hypothetical protein